MGAEKKGTLKVNCETALRESRKTSPFTKRRGGQSKVPRLQETLNTCFCLLGGPGGGVEPVNNTHEGGEGKTLAEWKKRLGWTREE